MNSTSYQKYFNFSLIGLMLVVIASVFWLSWRLGQLEQQASSLTSVAETGLPRTQSEPQTGMAQTESCDQDCIEKIVDERLMAVLTPTPQPTPTVKTGVAPTPTASAPTTSFVNISGGSAAGTTWTPVGGSEFWLDLSLYGNQVTTTWEGNLSIKDGNGIGYVRLYDMTNNRAVDSSQASVSNGETISFYSNPLAIWRGQNQYRIEVSSTTGYDVSVSSARLKLVSQ